MKKPHWQTNEKLILICKGRPTIKLYLNKQEYQYETENLIRLFFPCEKITYSDSVTVEEQSVYAVIEEIPQGKYAIKCGVTVFGKSKELRDTAKKEDGELVTALLLYKILCELCEFVPQWGVLTGVRPAKLLSMLVDETGSVESAKQDMNKRLLVDTKKIELCEKAYFAEKRALDKQKDNSFSLYVSIPFCPTRCAYCSFVSHSIEKAGKLVEPYVDLLC